ncbi:MAG: carbamoyl-phosphate synthase (glutamine-hydrolyzing) large subunit [Spirochaetes bacterium]|nr:carbamoyl-phosphate synthase (glutamine-hydrolyzing) large subunit [Spirochaetota bacterium]MBU1082402.1 carbamoyl-phosphate synthase (glutamine-hydrolyzing) large subunit [Spirochaetota bacterium]
MTKPRKVLLLGSGGLKIGQAGEFDYSGSQALKALREEGVRSVLVNPNIATIQTSEGMADATYFLPVTPEYVRRVIEKERPDGILLSFGGQTALNCGVALERDGTLSEFGVRVLGTPVSAIELTEDRDLFAKRLALIGVRTARSVAVTGADEAASAAGDIGYPVMVRAAYALGGSGSGPCADEAELRERCGRAFAVSPQVLVEEWLGGWKEIEYEVVRDGRDNCVAVCNMENFDPLGIHTGESIVVAPSQTLSDGEYQMLRSVALEVARSLGIVGECNIQYALDPGSDDYRVIEVNARLSRSSALASKATGYPLAFVAAELALGRSLVELRNRVTKATTACFEPAMDYCVVKAPRWDLGKFKDVDRRIGSEMKSVGEVMSIGRTFEEALQKALRMTGIGAPGLSADEGLAGCGPGNLEAALASPTDRRVFAVYQALSAGWSVERVHALTRIDPWFLGKMENVLSCERELGQACASGGSGAASIGEGLLRDAKRLGFSDARIARLVGSSEAAVRAERERRGVRPAVKRIDTLAAEFPADTNYLYMTYSGEADDAEPVGSGVMVLGSGAYRIGSSVEFDWCCVGAMRTAREAGLRGVMVNCNPETVSTDYDACDRLYFEELSLERVLDIYERERPDGVVLSMGGQAPNDLATALYDAGAHVFGTSPESIDKAEDRHKFSALLDALGIDQPEWKELSDTRSALEFAASVGYPVLVRPSYVLSGAAMNVAWDERSLERFLALAVSVSPDRPVVVTKFVEGAKEIEIDAVARRGEILFHAISEHVENAGVHSGDATVVLPAQRLYVQTMRRVRSAASRLAAALDITGPFNMQFLARNNRVSVIECNLRASRSFPFCSKVSRVDMIGLATKAMLGLPVEKPAASAVDLEWVGVKAAQFSFSRLRGADPVLGVEMASTGEVGCIGSDFEDAFLKAMLSVGYRAPVKGVLLSTGPIGDKVEFLAGARLLRDSGAPLYASFGTAEFLAANGVASTPLHWPLEGAEPNIATLLRERRVDLVINVPKDNGETELRNDYLIRRMAVDYDVPLFTNVKVARQFAESLAYAAERGVEIKAWEEYR